MMNIPTCFDLSTGPHSRCTHSISPTLVLPPELLRAGKGRSLAPAAQAETAQPASANRILDLLHDSHPGNDLRGAARAGIRQLPQRLRQPLARGSERGQ